MRHAEKTGRSGDTGLSPPGEDRGLALANAWPTGLDRPDVIIACRTTARSTRPVDTVRPLAERLGLAIDDRWGSADCVVLADHVATRSEYEDRQVLICWRHDTLPLLASSFGVLAPAAWPPELYDAFWLIERHGGALRLRMGSQQLPIGPIGPDQGQDSVQEDYR